MSTTIKLTAILTLAIAVILGFHVVTAQMVAAEGPDEPRLQGEGVITYNPPNRPALMDPVRSVVQGTRVDGECVITYTVSINSNEPSKVTRTVAFNPITCEELIEQGTLSQQETEVDGSPTKETTPKDEGIGTDSQGGATYSASSLPRKTKTFKATWEDPVHLDVNWQKTKMTWEYDSENNIVNYLSGLCTWYWLTTTGWTADPDEECKQYSQANGSRHVVEASRGFTNKNFPCFILGNPKVGAKTRMDNQKITANADGTYSGSVDFSKSGDCAWLLHNETSWE